MPNVQQEDFVTDSSHHPVKPALNQIRSVREFMRLGGQSVDKFDAGQTCLYIGLQLEELREQLEQVAAGHIGDLDPRDDLYQGIVWMKKLADSFKQGRYHGDVLRAPREKLLDGIIDSIVVSCGAAISYSPNPEGAFREVNRANMDKFPDGVATRDANGKIQKPAGWQEPNLTPYVQAMESEL